jgi:hypothetical protein
MGGFGADCDRRPGVFRHFADDRMAAVAMAELDEPVDSVAGANRWRTAIST